MSAVNDKRRRAIVERSGHLRKHVVITPEGVPLRFTLGTLGDRLSAFVFDFVIIHVVIVLIALLGYLATQGHWNSYLGAIVVLVTFLLRTFYFIYFELRWHGATPGKRRFGLRVIERSGGPLKGESVFARNLMRELEVFVPMVALLAPEILMPGATGLTYFVTVTWVLVLALMPLFNKQRLRVGDLVAGTIVVTAPKAVLLPDLSRREKRRDADRPSIRFSTEQLDVYGIFELQTLEKMLRGDAPSDSQTLEMVADLIKKKIGWPQSEWQVDPGTFLRDFYAAQRARLEHKLLLGKRQEFKRNTPAKIRSPFPLEPQRKPTTHGDELEPDSDVLDVLAEPGPTERDGEP